MKRIFTFLFLAGAGLPSFAQITWSSAIAVTSAGTGNNLHPRIALNRSGDPYVLWGKTDTRAYFSKWNGTSFNPPSVPSGALTVFAQSWAGPDMAVHGDTIYISMKVTPEGDTSHNCYLAHSYDGGMTFAMPVRIDHIDTSISRFPIVTANASGNPVVAFMKFNASFMNAQYVVARSTDGGATFSADVLASGSGNPVCDCCPATVVSSGANVIMLYRDNASNIRDTWAGLSGDGGMTFPVHMNVDGNTWLKTSCPASGPDGFVIGDSIYSVFMSGDTPPLVYYSRSSISMMTHTTAAFTGNFSGLSSQNYPRLANSGSAATAVWVQNTSSGKYVAYTFTNNISSGFSGYTILTGATGSGIMNADVVMAPGIVHVVWEDDNTGKVMYMKGTYSIPTSTEEVVANARIDVYPNPASDQFIVPLRSVKQPAYSCLVDMTGRHIMLTPTVQNNEALFSVKGIAGGNYFFVMTDNTGKSFYSKVILK